jgi:GT2 family glycosyltransferase
VPDEPTDTDTGGAEAAAAELTVLVVSYNTREMTLRCLETLHAETRATRFRVVVWDNASQDGSADAIAARFPQAALIRAPRNVGFARANNAAAARADGDWLLLLNSDTEIRDGAVDALMDFARANPRYGVYGGRTLFADGSLNPSSARDGVTPWSAFCHATGLVALFPGIRLFNPEAIGGWRRDSLRRVGIVQGSFLLLPTRLWRAAGGFDRRFWMYGEDVDLCYRLRAGGWQPVIVPQATIVHHGGASRASQARQLVLVARARLTLIDLYWPRAWRPWGRAMQWLWGANRVAASWLMARLGRPGAGARHALWREVWAHRRDWLAGYAEDRAGRSSG